MTSWHKVAELDELPDGRVQTVTAGHKTLALTHYDGRYGALDNRCPHQGGPLGEGTIEKGWLRCPWHGYDYSPHDGTPPEGFSDAPPCFKTEVRDDGVYVEIPPAEPQARTVSDVLVETMVNWNVTTVFGMVGHSNLGFADAMRRAEERGDLRYIGIRHEGAASFAASAYGKLTGGAVGCFAIAGPGSTNMLTGLYDAKVDRSPVLALSGQVPSSVAGRGAFQDLDLEAAFGDAARFTETVQAGSNHAELMTLACKNAIVGRGVAHLVLPDEVQTIESDADPGGPEGRLGDERVRPPSEALAAAVERMGAAERPVIVVGHGAKFDMAPVVALAERLHAPVMTTYKGKGQISDHHPLGAGVLGRSGTPVASWFMNESDLMVVFGASFSNHTGIAAYKPLIQVDYDPMALGRFDAVDIPVFGHVGVTASEMLDALPDSVSAVDQRPELVERWAIWRDEKTRRLQDDRGKGLNSASVFDALNRLADPDAIYCVDVGNNAYSLGRYVESRAHTFLMSGYLGSIGFALPAAMGAWAADTGRQIISVSGDGGLGQYLAEINTAVKYEMNITHIVVNNSELGKISKEQRAGEFDVWQTSLTNPDFGEYARLCGAHGSRVTDRSDLDQALRDALAHDGPALVDICIDPRLV